MNKWRIKSDSRLAWSVWLNGKIIATRTTHSAAIVAMENEKRRRGEPSYGAEGLDLPEFLKKGE